MPRQRQRCVTAPEYIVLGTQTERNRTVKEMWIQQLGGQCESCGEVYKRKKISRKFNSRVSKKMTISNLDAHYTGTDRKNHKGFQLGKLQVPMQNELAVQKNYLNNYINHLCPCKLLCKRCHGELHGRETGKCMHMHNACRCPNSFGSYGQYS